MTGSAGDALQRYGFQLTEGARGAGIYFQHEGPTLDPKLNHIMPQIASMGAAVSIVDFDDDGHNDIYAVNSREGSFNRLYRNRGDGTFEEVAERLGLADLNRPETGVSNPGGLPRVKLVHDVLNHATVRGIGRVLPEPLLARARALRARNLKRQGMTPDERAAAAAFFREDVLKTQDLIGRDLSAWLRA